MASVERAPAVTVAGWLRSSEFDDLVLSRHRNRPFTGVDLKQVLCHQDL